jgi:hypothetical protein
MLILKFEFTLTMHVIEIRVCKYTGSLFYLAPDHVSCDRALSHTKLAFSGNSGYTFP